ncbi:hypothetical protein VTI28DRAFT_590 [Corynascus sepedonium]
MPPTEKRSYSSTFHDHSTLPLSKKRRPPEVIVLSSSDTEPDCCDVEEYFETLGSDEDEDNCEVEKYFEALVSDEEEEDEHDDTAANRFSEFPESQIYRPRGLGLLEQLQQDAFDDYKADLCFELDGLCEPAKEDAEGGLRDVLQEWTGQDKASRRANYLYYRLDNKYSEDQFPPKVFVGRDASVTEILSRVAGELGLEIFLALLERDDKRPTPDYLVRSLVDFRKGQELISYFPVNDNNLLQTEVPSVKAPASGCDTAIMLIPRDSLADYLIQYANVPAKSALCPAQIRILEGLIKTIICLLAEPNSRNRLLPVFKELCVRIWQLDEQKGLAVLSEITIQNILKAVVKAEDWSFLEEAASHLGDRTPIGFFTWVADQLVSESLSFAKLERSLLVAASSSTTFFDKLHIAWQLLSTTTPQPECRQVARHLITDLPEDIGSCGPCSALGLLLVDLIYMTQEDTKFLEFELTQFVEKASTHTSFILGILDGLRFGPRAEHNISSIPNGLFERLAQLCIDSLDLSKLFQRGQHAFTNGACMCSGRLSGKLGSAGAVDAFQLSGIVSHLLVNRADSVMASLAYKIVADVALIPREEFTSLWLPFLDHLVKVLAECKVPLPTPRYRHLFAAILETYLTRCVGSLPYAWTPRFTSVRCKCGVCRSFSRFLSSNVSAASFSSLSFSDVGHINATLIPSAWGDFRCQFQIEGGVLIVRKIQEVDPGVQKCWTDNMEKANLNIGRLDGPVLREILGDEYSRIRNFQSRQTPEQASPVPIDTIDDSQEGTVQLVNPVTSVSTTLGVPSISAHQPRTENCPRLSPPPHAPSVHSQYISYSSLNPLSGATTPRNAASAMCGSNDNQGIHHGASPLPAPGSTPRVDPFLVDPWTIFADEQGPRLRSQGSHQSDQHLKVALMRQWFMMSTEEKQPYVEKARQLRSSLGSTVFSSSLPTESLKVRLPATPKPAPDIASSSSQSAAFWGLSNSVSEHNGPGVARAMLKPPAQASTPHSAAQRSSSSSRVFGASISSSRLNSTPTSEPHTRVNAGLTAHATQQTTRKQQAAVVIDLTQDD